MPTLAQIVARFLDIPEPSNSFYQANVHLAHYPALLALYAAGLGALSEARFDNLRTLFLVGVPSRRTRSDEPFLSTLHRDAPFAQDFWRLLPGSERRHTPISDRTLEKLTEILPDLLVSGERAERAFDRLESTVSAGYMDVTFDSDEGGWAPLGSYAWRDPLCIDRMLDDVRRLGTTWPPILGGFFLGSVERAVAVLDRLKAHLIRVRQQTGMH
jgi:hypothetical protein